jgi:hypothetical protein
VVVQRPGAEPLVATLEASPDGHFSGLIPSVKFGGRYRYRIDGIGPFPRFRCRVSVGLARVGPTTPKRAGSLADASVAPTDARKVVLPARRLRLGETPWPPDGVQAGASLSGNHLSIPFTA